MNDYLLNLSPEHRQFLVSKTYEQYDGHLFTNEESVRFLVYKPGATTSTCAELCDMLIDQGKEEPLKFVIVEGTGDEDDALLAFEAVDGHDPDLRDLAGIVPFAIFPDGSGALVVDTTTSEDGASPVLVFENDDGSFQPIANSIADFLAMLDAPV